MDAFIPKPPALRLHWSGITDRGKVRKNNEDSFLCLQFDAQELRYLGKVGAGSTENADYVFAVSDGMGGAQAGELASRIAVEKITALLPRAYHQSARGLEAGVDDVLFGLATIVTVAVASTLYPAVLAARVQPIVAMQGREQ